MVNRLIDWNFDDMDWVWDSFDRLQERLTQRMTPTRTLSVRVPIDVYETDHDIVVVAPLPGVDPDDVDVRFERGVLTIRGEFKPPLGNVDYRIQEIPYGTFSRSLTIDIPVQEEEIGATFEHGIITVSLPKAATARPRTIRVRVQRD